MLMNPVSGLFAWISNSLGLPVVDWFTNWPMTVGHHHRRLAMAAVREPDHPDRAAIARRGAEGGQRARRRRADLLFLLYRAAAHLARAITVVMLIETIFLLNVFAEIRVTTNGGPVDDQYSVPNFRTGHQRQRCRRRGGGRHRRRHPRQHRRVLPCPHDRQEPGELSHGAASQNPQARRHDGSGLARRFPDLLPDSVDLPDRLQDRGGRLCDPAEIPVLPLDDGELRRRCSSAPTTSLHAFNSIVLSIGCQPRRPGHLGSRRLGDGVRADQAHQGPADVDALDQDDAGRGRVHGDLFHLPAVPPARQPLGHRLRSDDGQPADPGLDALHLLQGNSGRHPRGRAHGRRLAVRTRSSTC